MTLGLCGGLLALNEARALHPCLKCNAALQKNLVCSLIFPCSSNESGLLPSSSGLGSHAHWLSGATSSPLVAENASSGEKELKLRFDVSSYTPEEIMVKTVDNKLLVHAKHEEKGEGKSVYREYNREFLLPEGTDPEAIKSSLSRDGVLTVEAPLPKPALQHKK